jgi:hypothetical protein
MSIQDLWRAAEELERSQSKGLREEEMSLLPTSSYAPQEEEEDCKICWSSFEKDEVVKRLPCLHQYHTECIDQWLKVGYYRVIQ